MTFGASAFLWALGLIGVPILIHLLNRRRYRDIDWAPMKYLKLSIRTNRRKIRLEQLLLLLIRTLFVAAIVFAICRPRVTEGGALDWLAYRSKVARLVVIDDSLSMDVRTGDRSSFDLAKSVATRLVEAMDTDDALTVVTTSEPSRTVAEAIQIAASERGPILDAIATLAPTRTGSLWAEVFEQADRHLNRSPYPVREITVVTDRRATGWTEEITRIATRMAGNDIRLRLIDVSIQAADNVVLADLRQTSPAALKGVPCDFAAEVRNDGSSPIGPLSASLAVGTTSRTIRIPRIAAGESLAVPFSVTFREPGVQSIGVTLPNDTLPLDNTRWRAVDVRSQLDLVLVDGDPSTEPFQSETDYLQVAFTIGNLPWRVYAITDSEWLGDAVPAADLTVIANVGGLRPEHTDRLERLVAEGMGLILFPGDQTDSDLWNELLWKDGKGLSPARVIGATEEAMTGLVIEPEDESPLDMLTRVVPEALKRVSASKILDLALGDDEGVRVLARWDDIDRTPAVVERRFGRGRVLLIATTADRAWTDWPTEPTWLLSMREAGVRVAHPGVAGLNLEAGQAIVFAVGNERTEDPEILEPGTDERTPLAISTNTGARALIHDRTAIGGVFEVTWKDDRAKIVTRRIALNPALAESDLKELDPARIEDLLGPMRPTVTHHSRLDQLIEGEGREIWRTLVTLALVLLVIESTLMVWVGRQG